MSKYFFGCGETFCGDFYTFHCSNADEAYKKLESNYDPTSAKVTVALRWDEEKNRFIDLYESQRIETIHGRREQVQIN
jgi:hypothetical protein